MSSTRPLVILNALTLVGVLILAAMVVQLRAEVDRAVVASEAVPSLDESGLSASVADAVRDEIDEIRGHGEGQLDYLSGAPTLWDLSASISDLTDALGGLVDTGPSHQSLDIAIADLDSDLSSLEVELGNVCFAVGC